MQKNGMMCRNERRERERDGLELFWRREPDPKMSWGSLMVSLNRRFSGPSTSDTRSIAADSFRIK